MNDLTLKGSHKNLRDLRIVIVSWNVQDYLARCLASLPVACEGLDWECVVVDNASSDQSVEIAHGVGSTSVAPFRVMENPTNLGFAKACNLGSADLDARYVLFLNPDTECPPGSLQKLVAIADAQPKAGILGPKITNPDGSFQESIRRFPTVWSQVGILLKLHHIFPWLKTFRSYFAKDLDGSKAQSVDQVMGACFLVRKELIDQKLGFDERYFLWFEEVDFCKTAIQNGWQVRYEPSVSIIHARGKSFAQAITVTKQRYLDTSLKKYFQKWHPGWQSALITLAHPIAMFQAYVLGALRTPYGKWMCLVIGVEILSGLTIFTTFWNTIAVCAIALIVGILAWKRPTIALAALLLELLIGSKGYLLQFGGWPSSLSLRIVMTVAFLAGWLLNYFSQKSWKSWKEVFSIPWLYYLLFLTVLHGIGRGIVLHNAELVSDANAWMFLVLIFPVIDCARRYKDSIRKVITPVLIIGLSWIAIKVALCEVLFALRFAEVGSPLYLWIRRTGIGEITALGGDAYRIFFQSSIFAVMGLIVGASQWIAERRWIAWWIMVASTVTLLLSLSRSFWIGTAVGGLALIGMLLWNRAMQWKRIAGILGAVAVGLLAVTAVLPVSIPDFVIGRASASEPAAMSRWSLLPMMWEKIQEHPVLGSGFGGAITYQTKDPRVLALHPDGQYTTAAFEWGWLDHWIEFGIIGIPVMLAWLIWLGRRVWRLQEPLWLRAGFVASLCALAALHFFTPYLNHPLGFVILLIGEGMILSSSTRVSRE